MLSHVAKGVVNNIQILEVERFTVLPRGVDSTTTPCAKGSGFRVGASPDKTELVSHNPCACIAAAVPGLEMLLEEVSALVHRARTQIYWAGDISDEICRARTTNRFGAAPT